MLLPSRVRAQFDQVIYRGTLYALSTVRALGDVNMASRFALSEPGLLPGTALGRATRLVGVLDTLERVRKARAQASM